MFMGLLSGKYEVVDILRGVLKSDVEVRKGSLFHGKCFYIDEVEKSCARGTDDGATHASVSGDVGWQSIEEGCNASINIYEYIEGNETNI